MENVNLIKIINEELKNFDFLGNDEFLKEQESVDLLQDTYLQKQFICDTLLRRTDKVKILNIIDSDISGDWDDPENVRELSLEHSVNIEYQYDRTKEPVIFSLNFSGDNIRVSIDGYDDPGRYGGSLDSAIEPNSEYWFTEFDFTSISVELHTNDDEIPFVEYEKAPQNIKTLFIKEFIEDELMFELRTDDQKINIQNTPYC